MQLPNYQSLSFGELKSKISRLEEINKPEQDFLFANINDWMNSAKRKMMLTAQEYYLNRNDIKDRKRYYIDRQGNKREVTNLSNNKLCHPFMRKLTDQKVDYLLSKEFAINCDDENFAELLNRYLDKKFRRLLKNVGKQAVINGIAWLQVYYNGVGELCFKRIPSEEVIPFWADSEHTILDAIIRVYCITEFAASGSRKEIYKVEYHTLNGVWYYVMGDKGLKPDPDMGDMPKGHFRTEQKTNKLDENGNPIYNEVETTWDRIPFIAFKYSSDEISLLNWIKSLIDDYDLNTSDTANNLQDVPNNIKIVRNYDGTDKGEFVQNLAVFRTAFVANDGDMTMLNTPLDVTAIDSHLNRLRKDIYDAGNGVDIQDENLGNASGVALKFRYAGLDSDAYSMGNEFSASLEDLIWFIKTDIAARGLGEYMDIDVDIIFNTDMIINESEIINDAKTSLGIISDETIIANHPWVPNALEELDKIKKQKEEELKENQKSMMFETDLQYGNGPNDDNKDGDE